MTIENSSYPSADQREALKRALAHTTLGPSAKIVLNYLFQRFESGLREPASEKEILAACFGREWSYESNRVRTHIARLRRALAHYFDHDLVGRSQQFRVAITRRGYLLQFTPNVPPPGDEVKRFWQSYCDDKVSTLIVFGQPLFFRAADRSYVRSLNVNTRDNPGLVAQLLRDKAHNLVASYHYVSAGEVTAALRLMQLLQQRGARVEFANVRDRPTLATLHGHRLIILGSENANRHIAGFEQDQRFIVGDGCVQILSPTGELLNVYSDTDHLRSNSKLSKYAVMTRLPNPKSQQSDITLIAATDGRAVQGVVEFLTSQEGALSAERLLGCDRFKPVPLHFQIAFRIDVMGEGESEIQRVEPLDYLVYS